MKNKLLFWVLIQIIVLEFSEVRLFEDAFLNASAESIIVRYLAAFSIFLLIRNDRKLFPKEKLDPKNILALLPCFLVALNNLPFIPLIKGNARIIKPWYYAVVLLIDCFGVAFFEELIFRGLLFQSLRERLKDSPLKLFWAVVIQAAVFGGMHLFNLFSSAFPVVLLQVGYSFLIGAMFAIALLISKNILVAVFLHLLYNFGGLLLPSMGEGNWADLSHIVITVAIALAVGVYLLLRLLKISKSLNEEKLIQEN